MYLKVGLTQYQFSRFNEFLELNKYNPKMLGFNYKRSETDDLVPMEDGLGTIYLFDEIHTPDNQFMAEWILVYKGPRISLPFYVFQHMAGDQYHDDLSFTKFSDQFLIVSHKSMFSNMLWYEQHANYLFSERSTLEDWEKLARLRPDSPLLKSSCFCIRFCNPLDVEDILNGNTPFGMYMGRYVQSLLAQRVVQLTRQYFNGTTDQYKDWLYQYATVNPKTDNSGNDDEGILGFIILVLVIIFLMNLF